MKKRLSIIAIAAALMITIPLLTVRNNALSDIGKLFNSEKENSKTTLTDIIAYNFREEYCDEGLKAISIILNSNYKSGAKLKSLSKDKFIKKYKNGKDYYSKIEKTANAVKDTYIKYKNKAVKIPYSYITNGHCEAEYPYLKSAANPWDLLSESYTYNKRAGVSLNSLNILCEKGLSAEEALSRYVNSNQ